MIAKLFIVGMLTERLVTKYLPSGTAVVEGYIEYMDGFGDNAKPQKVKLKAFGKTGEEMQNAVFAGQMIAVDGSLAIRNYKNRNDQWEKAVECVVKDYRGLSPSPETQNETFEDFESEHKTEQVPSPVAQEKTALKKHPMEPVFSSEDVPF